jgi:type IV pilus assembly protein PilM
VLPSSLAALESLDSMEAVLIANLSQVSLTTAISNGQDLLLYRTLDLPPDEEHKLAEVQRGIAVAAAYFEDKLGSRPQRLYFAGTSSAEAFAHWTGDLDLSVVDLAAKPETGATTSMGEASFAGVAGALAGVR